MTPERKEWIRTRAQMVRDGTQVSPETLKSLEDTARAEGLDFDTLISGSNAGSAWGGTKAGLSFRFNDEIAGGLAAVNPFDGGKGYEQARDQSRAVHDTMQFMDPWAYGAGEVGAGVAASFVPVAGQVGRGAGMAKMAATGATLGAADGYVTSIGNQDGPKDLMNWETTLDAGLGGVFGAAGGIGGKFIGDLVAKKGDRAAKAAAEEMQRIMKATGMDPDAVFDAITSGKGSAVTQNVTLQKLARAYKNNASMPVRTEVTEDALRLAKQSRDELLPQMQRQLPDGPLRDPGITLEQGRKALDVPDRPAKYNEAYRAANERGPVPGMADNLAEATGGPRRADLRDVIEESADNTNYMNRREGIDSPDRGPVFDSDGRPVRDLNAQEIDALQRAQSANAKAAAVPAQGSTAVPNRVPRAMAEAKDTRSLIAEHMPELDDLMKQVSTSKAAQDTFEAVRRGGMGKENAQNIIAQWDELSDEQVTGVKAALLHTVRTHMSGRGANAQPLAALVDDGGDLSNPVARLISRAFGDADLQKAVDLGVGRQGAYNALTSGSQTAELADLTKIIGGQQPARGPSLAQSGVMDFLGGTMGLATGANVAERLLRSIGQSTNIPRELINDRMLRALMTENPQVFKAAMDGSLEGINGLRKLMIQMADRAAVAGAGMGAQGGGQILPMLQQ